MILEAYNTLNDPRKRQIYDATLEFNDHIPDEFHGDEDEFMDLFSRLFRLNSYWSVHKPVPPFGDKDSSEKEIKKFYDFWFNFSSNRDFKHEDEYDIQNAEC